MPLYGHELTTELTPFESSLGRYVRLDKKDFIGREILSQVTDPARLRVGLEMVDRGIAREGYDIYSGSRQIGQTTSGTFCPFIEKAVAMAIIEKEYSAPDTMIEIDVRGRRIKSIVVPTCYGAFCYI